MKTKLIILFSTFSLALFSQHSFDDVDSTLIKSWFPKLEYEYQAVYHFGTSEWESNLILICGANKWYAQIVSGSWSNDNENLDWILTYENLSNVRVENNKFYSDKTNGEFVYYDRNNKRIKGLKVYNSWSYEDEIEIGYWSHTVNAHYLGKYPQASLKLLSREEVLKLTKPELKIMRNEIFARYGYKFKPNGQMDKYFREQDWYKGQHDNVNGFLTEIEKENINLIRLIENK